MGRNAYNRDTRDRKHQDKVRDRRDALLYFKLVRLHLFSFLLQIVFLWSSNFISLVATVRLILEKSLVRYNLFVLDCTPLKINDDFLSVSEAVSDVFEPDGVHKIAVSTCVF